MNSVEQSIILQIQDIAAVKQSFSGSLAQRQPDTLWWLVDESENIIYENRVQGAGITAIDESVDSVSIGSLYSNWFALQNAYFSQDQPFTGVSSIQAAIATIYRWRVSQYFNDIAVAAAGQGVSPQYVFPYPDFNLGTYPSGGAFTKGNGPVDPTKAGPGILGVIPLATTSGSVTLSITAVYPVLPNATSPPPPPVVLSATVPATPANESVSVGGQALTADYTPDTVGQISVAATTGFLAGYPVVVSECTPGDDSALPVLLSEVAEVVSIGSGTMVLRQLTPPGGTPFTPGLRNPYTTAAKVYPLFSDVTAVTGGGTDDLQIGFYPDWPQGFVDVTSIVKPQ